MKFKKLLTNALLAGSSLLLFSCHNSLEIIKKRYSPGYYVAFSGQKEKKNPPTALHHPADSIAVKPLVHIAAHAFEEPVTHPDLLKPSVIDPVNLTASVEKTETTRPKRKQTKQFQSVSKNHEQKCTHYFLPDSSYPDDVSAKPKIPLLYKIAIIFLLLFLLSLLFAFASAIFPAINFLAYAGAVFPELWVTGIILAIIGFIKYRKIPDALSPELLHLNGFSKTAFILSAIELILLPFIVIATFLIVYSFTSLITLVLLFAALFLVSFVFGAIGLIKVLKDPMQSKKNRLKALLTAMFSIVPACLLIAWFVAVGTFIAAALPYFAAVLFILH